MGVPGAVTDPTKVQGSNVTYPSGDTDIEAYFARPAAPGTYPGVIVIHEAFGPNDHIHDLARRFANAGFLALAPNLYTRLGTPAPTDFPAIMSAMFGVADSQVVADLEAGADHLRSQDGASGKVGCIGFCSGGRHTLLFACSSGKLDAAVDCWGGFIDRASPEAETMPSRPTPVIELAENLGCPLLAVGGVEDDNPSPAILADLEKRLHGAGKTAEVKIFSGAGHAFLADYRDSYREGPANELWPQIIRFFDQHLRA